MNLAHLAQAGFAVPPGFTLTTAAYDAFVTVHALDERIHGLLSDLSLDDRPALNAASQTIRAWFAAHAIPPP
jgi:pyruvate,water dikinase